MCLVRSLRLHLYMTKRVPAFWIDWENIVYEVVNVVLLQQLSNCYSERKQFNTELNIVTLLFNNMAIYFACVETEIYRGRL